MTLSLRGKTIVSTALAAALAVSPAIAMAQNSAPAAANPPPATTAAPAPAAQQPAAKPPVARHAMRSQRTTEIQAALNKNGAALDVDGRMGPKTHSALMAFQKSHGLQATGRPDAATTKALGL